MSIADRLQSVRAQTRAAALRCGRHPDAVRLLAVSKTFAADAVREAAAAGQREFGENYVDEALAKIAALGDVALCWHFIGPIQSNKTRAIATHFDWVHSVDRLKTAQRLSAQRDPGLPPLQLLVQVNISGEASKSGCPPEQALALCLAVEALPQLELRGLMGIPAPRAAGADPQLAFRQLRLLADTIRPQLRHAQRFTELSAGMSDDMAEAIAEGSTMVRIGSAIFGARTPPAGG